MDLKKLLAKTLLTNLGLVFIFLSALALPSHCFGESPSPSPVAVASPAPTTTPSATPAGPSLPDWATSLITIAEGMPVVGPYVSKLLVWLGILASVLTALVASLLAALASLKGAFNLAGLTTISSALDTFQNGSVMYWLKYFSIFNAQKPAANPGTTPS